jgi:hypothetical protein
MNYVTSAMTGPAPGRNLFESAPHQAAVTVTCAELTVCSGPPDRGLGDSVIASGQPPLFPCCISILCSKNVSSMEGVERYRRQLHFAMPYSCLASEQPFWL